MRDFINEAVINYFNKMPDGIPVGLPNHDKDYLTIKRAGRAYDIFLTFNYATRDVEGEVVDRETNKLTTMKKLDDAIKLAKMFAKKYENIDVFFINKKGDKEQI